MWLHCSHIILYYNVVYLHLADTLDLHPRWTLIQLDEHNHQNPIEIDKIVKRFQLKAIPWEDIKGYDIHRSCELKELTEEVNSEFKIGRTFCEFRDELETLHGQTKIIFKTEVMTVLTDV